MGTTLWLDKSQVAAKNKAKLAEQAEAAEKGILCPKLSRQKKNKHIRQALFPDTEAGFPHLYADGL